MNRLHLLSTVVKPTITPNAPPIWYFWAEYVWAVLLVLALIAESELFTAKG